MFFDILCLAELPGHTKSTLADLHVVADVFRVMCAREAFQKGVEAVVRCEPLSSFEEPMCTT